uniref:MFMR domain-containing protein n=1 Tax=Heterorhabditis bacteriophora TaxID=37862 RepID=A0A1I7XGC6_HETBA
MVPSTPFSTYSPFPSFVSQPSISYPPFVFSNTLTTSPATTSANTSSLSGAGSSSNAESPPPEPKVSELKMIPMPTIPVPGTAEFDQRNETKYLTMGIKTEKEETKFAEPAKYIDPMQPTPPSWGYNLPAAANYAIYNNFYGPPPYYPQYSYGSEGYTPQNPAYCGQL